MMSEYNKIGFLSGSTLKIIACLFMVIDHVGLTFFPECDIFRILGRLAFPIFAFFIAEGSRYSRNKLRRLSLIFIIGIAFFAFYYIYDGTLYGNIFLTFSVSILLDNFLYECKKNALCNSNKVYSALLFVGFFATLAATYYLYSLIHFEYRFFGMLLPVLINLTNFRGIETETVLKKLDNHMARIFLALIGMILLSIDGNLGVIQFYCLLSIIPLALYNGKVGCKKMKYAFYVFYPAHLIIIEGIAMLLTYIK